MGVLPFDSVGRSQTQRDLKPGAHWFDALTLF